MTGHTVIRETGNKTVIQVVGDTQTVIRSPKKSVIISSGIPGRDGPAGPAGPAGPQGPPGSATSAVYAHDQAVASDTWVINHNLGFNPAVSVFDTAGDEIEGEVRHTVTFMQTTISFNVIVSGTAYLS